MEPARSKMTIGERPAKKVAAPDAKPQAERQLEKLPEKQPEPRSENEEPEAHPEFTLSPLPAVTPEKTEPAAETSSSEMLGGDVIHKVSYTGETLRIISAWYTGDPANAGRIARINDINNPNLLFLGQTIRLPRYLLLRSDPLPQEEVEKNRAPSTALPQKIGVSGEVIGPEDGS